MKTMTAVVAGWGVGLLVASLARTYAWPDGVTFALIFLGGFGLTLYILQHY
jgi:hypothetical protein